MGSLNRPNDGADATERQRDGAKISEAVAVESQAGTDGNRKRENARMEGHINQLTDYFSKNYKNGALNDPDGKFRSQFRDALEENPDRSMAVALGLEDRLKKIDPNVRIKPHSGTLPNSGHEEMTFDLYRHDPKIGDNPLIDTIKVDLTDKGKKKAEGAFAKNAEDLSKELAEGIAKPDRAASVSALSDKLIALRAQAKEVAKNRQARDTASIVGETMANELDANLKGKKLSCGCNMYARDGSAHELIIGPQEPKVGDKGVSIMVREGTCDVIPMTRVEDKVLNSKTYKWEREIVWKPDR